MLEMNATPGATSGGQQNPAPLPVAAIVLAAGRATRMGRLKQVMPCGGEPMVRRVAATCLAAGLGPVWVVTGYGAPEVEAVLAGLPGVRLAHNPDYAAGQASSLIAGIRAVMAGGQQAAAVLLADQPFVRPRTVARLAQLALTPGVLAAAALYGPGKPGPPCVVRRPVWPAFLELEGDRGGRAVLLSLGRALRTLPIDAGELRDVDEPVDPAGEPPGPAGVPGTAPGKPLPPAPG